MNNRVGQLRKNNFGSDMEVVEYNNALDIWVKFYECNNLVNTTWKQFCNGEVRNPFDKTVYKVGYLGKGKYKTRENGKNTSQYDTWRGLLKRSYDSNFHKKEPTYIGCTVVEEWHNFQNFAKWFDENYYEIDGERMHLDKDILIKGNKIYSPDTCVFVPQLINNMFIKKKSTRGNFPIGVCYHKENNKYITRCGSGKQEYKGTYDTAELAFQAYKINKEKYIKYIAEEHKEKIPKNLYEAMINYKVEITD